MAEKILNVVLTLIIRFVGTAVTHYFALNQDSSEGKYWKDQKQAKLTYPTKICIAFLHIKLPELIRYNTASLQIQLGPRSILLIFLNSESVGCPIPPTPGPGPQNFQQSPLKIAARNDVVAGAGT